MAASRVVYKHCTALSGMIRGGVKSVMKTNALLTFSTSVFAKYDILTKYVILFWFVLLRLRFITKVERIG